MSGFRDGEFDYQLLRTMGLSDYGGSTVGECLAAAVLIEDGHTASWASAFGALAARLERRAEACLRAGHDVSARDHFLRASTYHRTAEYYGEVDPLALNESARAGTRCFRQAVALSDSTVETVTIPFGSSRLPGYLVHPSGRATATGTVMVVGGFDSSAEELYFQWGVPGSLRGWQVLVFDGPGQGGAMRDDPGLCFRPDYEAPLAAVADFVESLGGPRSEALVLVGSSFGGYFAMRAAASDDRIAALVADPPLVDLYRYMEAWLGDPVFSSSQDIRPEDVAGVPRDLLLPQMAWGIVAVCRRFGVPSLHRWLEVLDSYRATDLVGQIACPVLALVGAHEGDEVTKQAGELASGVSGEVTTEVFEMDDGADAHCQVGNLRLAAQVAFDWLDELFA